MSKDKKRLRQELDHVDIDVYRVSFPNTEWQALRFAFYSDSYEATKVEFAQAMRYQFDCLKLKTKGNLYTTFNETDIPPSSKGQEKVERMFSAKGLKLLHVTLS